MLKRIVVPLDGSSFGEQALPMAASLARRAGIGLELAHVHVRLAPIYREPMPGLETSIELQARSNGERYLNRIAERVEEGGGIKVKPVQLDGSVPEAVVTYTGSSDETLLVMTTHGRGPLKRFWIGSTTDQLLRSAKVPMLMLHPNQEGPADLKKDCALPFMLVALDGTEESEGIINPALAIGGLMQSDFTVMQVVEPMMLLGYDPMGYIADVPSDPDLLRRQDEAREYLDRVAARMSKAGARVRTRVVAGYYPSISIVDEAAMQGASWIAMQTHGRRGLGRLLLGSVADKVIRSTPVPVLIHRPANK